MKEPINKQKTYTILAWVFGIAGVSWIICGLIPPAVHFILYPLIGLVNLGVAYYCWQTSQTA